MILLLKCIEKYIRKKDSQSTEMKANITDRWVWYVKCKHIANEFYYRKVLEIILQLKCIDNLKKKG